MCPVGRMRANSGSMASSPPAEAADAGDVECV
jgi:hypothetical protein